MNPLEPDLERLSADLKTLASFRDGHLPGWTRRVFSAVDRDARGWVAEQMRAAGLEVETDAGANLVGRLRGTGGGSSAVVSGSHTDTVYGGGRFDGVIGVLGAIEAVRCLGDAGVRLAHDLVVVDFLGEEPNDFGISCVGSRAVAGALEAGHLELPGPRGRTLAHELELAGGDPATVLEITWPKGSVHCFVELHIEQGPRLERGGAAIASVTGIAGIHRLVARFEGRPDHAGTTPMADRRDALLGAAEAALLVEQLAGGSVATAGRLDSEPGASNVVPSGSELWAEARSDDEAWLTEFGRRLEAGVGEIGTRRQLGTALSWTSREQPVAATDWVAETVCEAARAFDIEPLRLPSGAGHDAAHMANLGPMGMIFVPSREGRSHCPEEWTDIEDVGKGVAVLIETLRRVDEAPSSGPPSNEAPSKKDRA